MFAIYDKPYDGTRRALRWGRDMKITWKVASEPTGRWRSFETRAWPMGYLGSECVAYVACSDSYTPARARGEQPHRELTVRLARRRFGAPGFSWVVCTKRVATLAEAKQLAHDVLNRNRDMLPGWHPPLEVRCKDL